MKCKTETCTKESAKHRSLCHTCRSAEYSRKFPIECAFKNLKSNAKRRKKKFLLTIDEFREFCVKTDYIVGKGISKESYHIDRIDEEGAYELSNIQILTNSENKKKNLIWIRGQRGESTFKVEIQKEIIIDKDLPF